MPRHSDRFRCPRCTHLETWTFYEPLVSGRARRRQRQWHTSYAGFPGDVPLRAVFPSVVVRPELLDIMVVMYQKDSTTLVVNHVRRPMMLGIMAVLDQKDSGSGMYRVGFTGFGAPRDMFPTGVAKAQDARHLGPYGPGRQFTLLWQWHVQGGYCWFLCTSRCVLPWLTGP